MKTLVTANQKGGVGKTATLVHLAFDFAERGLKVAIVDLDPQANASYTLHAFACGLSASNLFAPVAPPAWPKAAEHQPMVLIGSDTALPTIEQMPLQTAGTYFQQSIATLTAQGFDVCLIDTAPSLGITMAAALLASDYVLSPIELESYSIQGIKKLLITVANVRRVNPGLKFLGMVPSKVDGRNPRHGRHLAELTTAYPALILPTSVGLRSSIADALASCVPVWKIRKTTARKAAEEVRNLAAHVFQQMEIAV